MITKRVVVVSDASYCHKNKVGGLGWIIELPTGEKIHGGRAVLVANNITELEKMAASEALQDSRRFRKRYQSVSTLLVVDNLGALAGVKLPRVYPKENIKKQLLMLSGKRIRKNHAICDEIAGEMMRIAREEVNK